MHRVGFLRAIVALCRSASGVLLSATTKAAEPAWHRRQRAARSWARTIARLGDARDLLQAHHSAQGAPRFAMPGHTCFKCGAGPNRAARSRIAGSRGDPSAYWTCPCGGWTFVGASATSAPSGTSPQGKRRSPAAGGAHNADGGRPRAAKLGDWQVVDRRRRRRSDSSSAAPGGRRPASAPRQLPPTPPPPPKTFVIPDAGDGDDDMADDHEGADDSPGGSAAQDVEAIERLVEQLGRFADDSDFAELRARYEEKLRLARDASKPRDPTVLLLRAQRNTRRRGRHLEAARAEVRKLETKITDLLTEADEARSAVETAEEKEAEARLREESCRAHIAGRSPQLTPRAPPARPPAAVAEDTICGLRAQLEALPAAFRSGNTEAAHTAITAQFEALARGIAAAAVPSAPATPTGVRMQVPTGDTPAAARRGGSPSATQRDSPPVTPARRFLAIELAPGSRRRGSPRPEGEQLRYSSRSTRHSWGEVPRNAPPSADRGPVGRQLAAPDPATLRRDGHPGRPASTAGPCPPGCRVGSNPHAAALALRGRPPRRVCFMDAHTRLLELRGAGWSFPSAASPAASPTCPTLCRWRSSLSHLGPRAASARRLTSTLTAPRWLPLGPLRTHLARLAPAPPLGQS